MAVVVAAADAVVVASAASIDDGARNLFEAVVDGQMVILDESFGNRFGKCQHCLTMMDLKLTLEEK